MSLKIRSELNSFLINGDAGRLGQVITNLLSNAIKFSNEGGVVTVEIVSLDDHVRILVNDTGVGIPLNEQKNVFKNSLRLMLLMPAR